MLERTQAIKTQSLERNVAFLRAAGEPTRLRLLALLYKSDLTVSELTKILGQSQPRISRHLRLLVEAGLAERYQEGAWAYFRSADQGVARAFNRTLIDLIDIDDGFLAHDSERLDAVRRDRVARAAEYFSSNAASWDRLRSLHVSEERVEAAMGEIIGERQFGQMLDLGTGTGRVLEIFAPVCERAIGVDANRDMLSYARANLEQAGIENAQVRQGDLYQLPVRRNNFDLVTIHQVLHFLDDPALAIHEATRALAPSGTLLIVDFASHNLDMLREQFAHQRLGFSHEQVTEWLEACGLEVTRIHDVTPDKGKENKLTVTLWLARDQRILMAEASPGHNQEKIA